MIVLEGPDGGGKSTLAKAISKATDWPIVGSEGPPQSTEEFLDRIERYFKMGNRVIFDRHPCISNVAYDIIRDPRDRTLIPQPFIDRVYAQDPIIIYARNTDPKTAVADNKFDTPEHVAMYTANFSKLVEWYDRWALEKAHFIHRLKADHSGIVTACRLHAYRVVL